MHSSLISSCCTTSNIWSIFFCDSYISLCISLGHKSSTIWSESRCIQFCDRALGARNIKGALKFSQLNLLLRQRQSRVIPSDLLRYCYNCVDVQIPYESMSPLQAALGVRQVCILINKTRLTHVIYLGISGFCHASNIELLKIWQCVLYSWIGYQKLCPICLNIGVVTYQIYHLWV